MAPYARIMQVAGERVLAGRAGAAEVAEKGGEEDQCPMRALDLLSHLHQFVPALLLCRLLLGPLLLLLLWTGRVAAQGSTQKPARSTLSQPALTVVQPCLLDGNSSRPCCSQAHQPALVLGQRFLLLGCHALLPLLLPPPCSCNPGAALPANQSSSATRSFSAAGQQGSMPLAMRRRALAASGQAARGPPGCPADAARARSAASFFCLPVCKQGGRGGERGEGGAWRAQRSRQDARADKHTNPRPALLLPWLSCCRACPSSATRASLQLLMRA